MKSISCNVESNKYVELERIDAFQDDLKELTDDAFKALKKALIKHGIISAIDVWIDPEDNRYKCLDGHQRIYTLKKLEEKKYKIPLIPIDIVQAKSYKDAKEKLLSLAGSYGRVDSAGFHKYLNDNDISYEDIGDYIHYNELDKEYLKPEAAPKEEYETVEGEDDIPEEVEPVAKLGDLWQLGEHRLLCGDCMVESNIERLMNEEKADMVFTDPPYGLSSAKSFNNHHPDYQDEKPFDISLLKFEDNFVIWGANYYDKLPKPRNSIGWIVWDKRPTRENWQDGDGKREAADRIFGSHFEIAVCSGSPARGKMLRKCWGGFYGTKPGDINEIVHKTQKPVELLSLCVKKEHRLILDYFMGSGSTLIACEKTNRKCYGTEIDPHYCDVIIKRWEDFTGKKAKLLENING